MMFENCYIVVMGEHLSNW